MGSSIVSQTRRYIISRHKMMAPVSFHCSQHQQQCRSCAASSSSSSSHNTRIAHQVTGPTEKLKSWQSGARLVKNTKVENQYLEHIRDMHDPSLHLKTIEDELKGTIGKALGKQGEKILMYARLMHQERQKYDGLLEQHNDMSHRDVRKAAQQHNEYRKECLHERWKLIVHRQAVGFIVNNHKYVTDKFPIADALPENGVGDEDVDKETTDIPKKEKKTFGDQLDWWQRIGMWR
jgi:hypothetical protein